MDNNMLKFIEIRNSYYYPKLGELSINEQALIEYEKFCIELIKKCEKQKEVIDNIKKYFDTGSFRDDCDCLKIENYIRDYFKEVSDE